MTVVVPTVVMLRGLPASGKTTYATRLVAAGYKRVNKDDLRAMLDASKWTPANEAFLLKVRDYTISEALFLGLDVVVDDTNFGELHETAIRRIARKRGARMIVHFVDTPLETCLDRDRKRETSVGAEVILGMHEKYVRDVRDLPAASRRMRTLPAVPKRRRFGWFHA